MSSIAQVRLDLAQGGMQGPWLQEGRAAERSGEAHEAALPQGCLYNVDAGYFTLGEMRAHGKAGRSWLTTAKAGTLLIDERGQCWDLVSFLGAQTGDEVDTWRSAKPYRILTEIYSKLLGCLITHWLTLIECWQAPNRSMVKSAASGAVDGSGARLRRGRSDPVGDDGATYLAHHGLWLYRQCPSQEACGLSTGPESKAQQFLG